MRSELIEMNDKIEKELNNCKGFNVNLRLVALTNSLLIYQANVNEMILWHKKINVTEAALTIWDPRNYELMEQVNLEMQRLFTNFLSSAFSLRDHLYTLRNEYYKGTTVESKMEECIAKYFSNNYLTAFIQGFRNFVIHCGYPRTSKKLNMSGDSISNDIYFDVVQLKKFNGWTANSKKFLESMETQVKLIDIVLDYNKIINEYYSKIFKFLKEYHCLELRELKLIKDKYNLSLHMIKI